MSPKVLLDSIKAKTGVYRFCSQKEVERRTSLGLVHPLEEGLGRFLVKEFSRSSTNEDVRTVIELNDCCDYLLNILLPSVLFPNYVPNEKTLVRNGGSLEKMPRNDVIFETSETYSFFTDRLRAIRKDAIVQNLPAKQRLILILKSVRFHVIAEYFWGSKHSSFHVKSSPPLDLFNDRNNAFASGSPISDYVCSWNAMMLNSTLSHAVKLMRIALLSRRRKKAMCTIENCVVEKKVQMSNSFLREHLKVDDNKINIDQENPNGGDCVKLVISSEKLILENHKLIVDNEHFPKHFPQEQSLAMSVGERPLHDNLELSEENFDELLSYYILNQLLAMMLTCINSKGSFQKCIDNFRMLSKIISENRKTLPLSMKSLKIIFSISTNNFIRCIRLLSRLPFKQQTAAFVNLDIIRISILDLVHSSAPAVSDLNCSITRISPLMELSSEDITTVCSIRDSSEKEDKNISRDLQRCSIKCSRRIALETTRNLLRLVKYDGWKRLPPLQTMTLNAPGCAAEFIELLQK